MLTEKNLVAIEYVLLTEDQSYFVEYLLGELILSNSISEAMKFDDELVALKFKTMLYRRCRLTTSVNTYIEIEKV